MNETVLSALAWILPLVFAIVFHEVAHGWMARALGDKTAAELNRLSLNPLRHVDPVGTIILPGFLALAHLPVFGWAKPVPVVKERLRNPRFGMMAVATAGPAMNLLMAAVGAVILGLLIQHYGHAQKPSGLVQFIAENLINFLSINVFLALFNLLPIPPFDGSHIFEGLLPRRLAGYYAQFRHMGMLLAILLLVVVPQMVPGFDIIRPLVGPPMTWLMQQYLALASSVAML